MNTEARKKLAALLVDHVSDQDWRVAVQEVLDLRIKGGGDILDEINETNCDKRFFEQLTQAVSQYQANKKKNPKLFIMEVHNSIGDSIQVDAIIAKMVAISADLISNDYPLSKIIYNSHADADLTVWLNKKSVVPLTPSREYSVTERLNGNGPSYGIDNIANNIALPAIHKLISESSVTPLR